MEYATCKLCNNGTSAADVVASYIARIDPDGDRPSAAWKVAEAQRMRPALDRKAPGLHGELFRQSRSQAGWIRRGSLLAPTVRIQADGPMLRDYLRVFSAKLGMALYREHCGGPLPLDGGVICQAFLNGGLAQKTADTILSFMPVGGTLMQGRRNTAHGQFFYRYNTDDRTVVAALAGFHNGLYVAALAFADTARFAFLENMGWGKFIRPGELPEIMPSASRSWDVQLAMMARRRRSGAG